jgi:hypothetical protein
LNSTSFCAAAAPVVLAQQQRLHAGAVDEQVAFEGAVLRVCSAGDIAVVVRCRCRDMVRHIAHAQLFQAVLAQEHAELAGVEVIAVIGHRGEFRRGRLLRRAAVDAQVRLEAHQVGERHAGDTRAASARAPGRPRQALRQHERDGNNNRRRRRRRQPLKREPCLNAASHSRKNADSETPMRRSVSRIDGQVPSPTPIGATSGDSTSVTCSAGWRSAAMTPAVSQPAEPPPTMTTIDRLGHVSLCKGGN